MQAEVQSINKDGTVMLHTRGTKYGRLQDGQLVFYPCQLIKRQRQHFVNLTPEIRIIIGCNGLLWVSFIQSVQPKENSEDDDTGKYEQLTVVPASVKSKISMMAAQMNSYADLRIELNSKALMDLSEVIKLDEDAEV